ncbi:hypothetical protein BD289DRAFT_484171 [Coniella lustricola]|uniref:Pentatricopeptide repeat-containing protein-mitochondrial domain-containing protein n=1 Tax=Coniella lustricola TaxID=2025994 RepID=A0A2T3A2V6_9PEZI|nr:hypothetical protein BD289DRAFT_484171 [Coniella lustricola]
MPGARLTVDGLWRCLCPSVDIATLTRATSTTRLARSARASQRRQNASPLSTRCLHVTSRRGQLASPADQLGPAARVQQIDEAPTLEDGEQILVQDQDQDQDRDQKPDKQEDQNDNGEEPSRPRTGFESAPWPTRASSSDSLERSMVQRLVSLPAPFDDIPADATEQEIYDAIRETRHMPKPHFRKLTAALVKCLLARGTAPNTFIYETILLAHALPEGSAEMVRKMLNEMREKQIPWSSTAYHAALRALAIHPDYLIRQDIIREMKDRWIRLQPEGHRYVVLGLLRDEQYELALQKLDRMIKQGIAVDKWLLHICVYVFGKLGFTDDALRICRYSFSHHAVMEEEHSEIWTFLLDVCSKHQNHQATVYIWNHTVESRIINPSDGIALNALNMAATYGDTDLATKVIQFLSARNTRLGRPHYEALAEAYCVQGNMERAIEVYCIMDGAGIEVNPSSTGSLCQALQRRPELIDSAVVAMAELKAKYDVPIGIFNAIINETVKQGTPEAFDKALDLYRRLREFVTSKPNIETFRNLLWMCTQPDVAQFLAGEMVHFKVRRNLTILEMMFKVHVEHNGPIHRAKEYFFHIEPLIMANYLPQSRKWNALMDLAVKLIKRLIAERDAEAWRILHNCQRVGLDQSRIQELRDEFESGALVARPRRGDERDSLDGEEPSQAGLPG